MYLLQLHKTLKITVSESALSPELAISLCWLENWGSISSSLVPQYLMNHKVPETHFPNISSNLLLCHRSRDHLSLPWQSQPQHLTRRLLYCPSSLYPEATGIVQNSNKILSFFCSFIGSRLFALREKFKFLWLTIAYITCPTPCFSPSQLLTHSAFQINHGTFTFSRRHILSCLLPLHFWSFLSYSCLYCYPYHLTV